MNKKIGLIVNPVAGMGGSVGLKGTDGAMYKRALELGAEPVTPQRATETLSHIQHHADIAWLAAPDEMGAAYLTALALNFTVVGSTSVETSSDDTRCIAQGMLDAGVELLVFVGGDGTARDIYDAVGVRVPVVAVPAGVKVYSAVFALSARAAAELVDAFVEGTGVTEEEVLDIDEEAFRADRLASKLYGYLLVPDAQRFLQMGKQASSLSASTEENKRDIAASIVEDMDAETLYLLGPGSTVRAIADELGVSKTLLGVDAVFAGGLVGADLNERGILALLSQYDKRKIIVTPLGGNGFIFGRGNKQFTPEVIRRVGREHIIVVSTEDKVRDLPCLRVDTGDRDTDELLAGYMQVATGYRLARVMKVAC